MLSKKTPAASGEDGWTGRKRSSSTSAGNAEPRRRRKKSTTASMDDAEGWMRKAVRNAPHPLPRGVFPKLMAKAEAEGIRHEQIMDILDAWLNAGYCRVVDAIDQDIELTQEGLEYF